MGEGGHYTYHGEDCGEGIGWRGGEGDVEDGGELDYRVNCCKVVGSYWKVSVSAFLRIITRDMASYIYTFMF